MANEHLRILKQGVERWNKWRLENAIRPNLGRADLSGASLSDADLSSSDLSDAKLSGADLSGADLSDASLNGADLSEVDLSAAEGLTQAQLDQACGTNAKLPPGLTLCPCLIDWRPPEVP